MSELSFLSASAAESNILSKSTLQALQLLRKDHLLCDCVLVASCGEKFFAHKAVLAACSPFLRALFMHDGCSWIGQSSCADSSAGSRTDSDHSATSTSAEKSITSSSQSSITVKEILTEEDADLLTLILHFAYSGQIPDLSFCEIARLLPLADKWNLQGLIHMCSKLLLDRMRMDNSVGIWLFAKKFFCTGLDQVSKRHILYNIDQMALEGESAEFFGLFPSDLEDLLEGDCLNVRKETDVFWIIDTWASYDPAVRKDYVPSLLRSLRLGLCSTTFIENELLTHPVIQRSQESQTVLQEMRLQLTVKEDAEGSPVLSLDVQSRLLRPRIPHDVIFAVGGWTDGMPTACVETYDSKADMWFSSATIDANPRAYHGIAVVGHKIFVVGGFDGTEYYNSVRCYDTLTEKWKEAAPMYVARCYVSVAVLDDKIYAVGGYDGRLRLNSAEKYDPETNQWSLIAPMLRPRSDSCAAAFKGKLYIAGGFNGQEVLQTVEVYSPETNSWSFCCQMLSPRSGVSLVMTPEALYAMGGFDGQHRLTTVERYDPLALSWSRVPSMRMPRSNFAAAYMHQYIYAIGGFNGLEHSTTASDRCGASPAALLECSGMVGIGQTTVADVERFDLKKNCWEEVSPMALNRSAVKACVVHNMINSRNCTFHGHYNTPPLPAA